MALDFTDLVDQGNKLTSNAAKVIRGLLDGAERGATIALAELRPLAEQLDAAFGDENDPLPAPPEGGVPVAEHLEDDATAANLVGAVSS